MTIDTRTYMTFDADKLHQLRMAYEAARTTNASSFLFDNEVFDTGYAKYMIEYLTQRLHVK